MNLQRLYVEEGWDRIRRYTAEFIAGALFGDQEARVRAIMEKIEDHLRQVPEMAARMRISPCRPAWPGRGTLRHAAPITLKRLQRCTSGSQCHPKAPGLSLTGLRLVVADHVWGFRCFVRFPCVHAAATTPAQRLGVVLRSLHPAVSPFPERVIGSACALSFSRLARRSLALRLAHSRGHQFVTR